MKRSAAIALLCAATTCLSSLFPAVPLFAQPTPAVKVSPAALETQKRLQATVGDKGEPATIDLEIKGPIKTILDYIRDVAAAPPHNVKIIIDYQGVRQVWQNQSGGYEKNILDPATKGLSIRQALDLVLRNGLAYAIQDDGTVIVSDQMLLHFYTERWPVPEGQAADAAGQTRQRLRQKGVIDGQNYSIDLDFKDVQLQDVLSYIASQAAAGPHGVTILVDSQVWSRNIPEIIFGRPVTFEAKDITLEQALELALSDPYSYDNPHGGIGGHVLAYAILPDGVVLVSDRSTLNWDASCLRREKDREWTAAAQATCDKLRRRGAHENPERTVSVAFDKIPMSKALDQLVELAAAKPREVKLLVDRAALGDFLARPVMLTARNISLEEAIRATLGILYQQKDMVCVIRTDGTAVITRESSDVTASLPSPAGVYASSRVLNPQLKPQTGVWGNLQCFENNHLEDYYKDSLPELVHDLLGVPAADWSRFARFSFWVGTQGYAQVSLGPQVYLDEQAIRLEVRLLADPLVHALVEKVRPKILEEYPVKLAELRLKLEVAKQDLAKTTEDVKNCQAEKKQLMGYFGEELPDLVALASKATQLELREQDMRAEMTGRKARTANIEKKIAEISGKVAEGIKADALVGQLEKVVQLRQEQLAAVKALKEKGAAAAEQVAEKEIDLAESKARLAERQEAVRREAGGEVLTRLNTELAMVSIDAAESEAKHGEVQKQLDLARENVVKAKRLNTVNDLANNGPFRLNNKEGDIRYSENILKGADQPPELILP